MYWWLARTDAPQDTSIVDSEDARLKSAADWWLLSQVDGLILGSKSQYADKALLHAMHIPVVVRCSAAYYADNSTTLGHELNSHVPGWACRPVAVRDSFEGAIAL